MAGRTQSNDERKKHMAEVARLYCEGRYQHEIADALGVTRQQIGYDLKVLRRFWLTSAIRDFDAAKDRELVKIDNLEREYYEAWHRSREAKETVTDESVAGEKTYQKDRTVTEYQTGNPSYLAGVQWCINKRCEILGLDAAKKVENETKLTMQEQTPEQRRARINELERKRRTGIPPAP